jgi:hypothetical protein
MASPRDGRFRFATAVHLHGQPSVSWLKRSREVLPVASSTRILFGEGLFAGVGERDRESRLPEANKVANVEDGPARHTRRQHVLS